MVDFKIPLWEHQKKALRNASGEPCYGLFFEQGTGKSATAINILRAKYELNKTFLRTLVIGPSTMVAENWRDEWLMHSNLKSSEVIPLVGPGAKRLKLFCDNAFGGPHQEYLESKVFLTNFEALLMKPLFERFKEWQPQAIVWDESHRLKSFKAKRSKLASELSNELRCQRPYVYTLSGTPILNSPLDIFQQFLILDGGHTFGKNFFAFRARYFRDRNAGMPKHSYFPKWEVMTPIKDGFDALEEISYLMGTISMRVEKKDCLDLPPEIHQIVKVGMTPEQARLYKEMKGEFITFYRDKACTATIALTKALRLMQITSGFVNVESDTDSENVSMSLKATPKQEALKTMLEDLTESGHKVLVWAVWKENYVQIRQVCEELGVKAVEVHGGISAKQKQINIDQFKTDPSTKVFIGHPGSGGVGINLVVASYSIFYSRTFSLEHWLQARARNHRGGSKEEGHEKIVHYSLVCENTIDELVVKALDKKIEISDKVLGSLIGDLERQDF